MSRKRCPFRSYEKEEIMKTIGFIGCGNMASAIIKGLIGDGFDPADIRIYDHHPEKTDVFAKVGAVIYSDETEVAKNSDAVVIAIKPQVMKELLLKLGKCAPEAVYVNIAAGVTTASMKRLLGYDAKVVRVMPNTSLTMGLGATAICRTAPVSEDEFGFVKNMFACAGIVEETDEDMMNAIISVNGSSPAYVYYMAKAVLDGAEKQGIDRTAALRLFVKVLEGSAKMLAESGMPPQELCDRVCSKGGTTIEAINVFDRHSVSDAIIEGMEACTKRAGELDLN